MARRKQSVDVWECLKWECPNCCETNDGPSWLERGDEVQCPECGCSATVAGQTAECRPRQYEGKKAFA